MKSIPVVLSIVLAVGAIAAGPAAAEVPSPIVHWSFNDPANPGHDDSSGGHDLTIPGSWSSATGAPDWGQGIRFEGYGIGYTQPGSYNPTSSPWGPHTSTAGLSYPGPTGFTVAYWCKVAPDLVSTVVWDYWQHVAAGETFGLIYNHTEQKASFFIRTGFTDPAPSVESPVTETLAGWIHLAGVYEPVGYGMKLYVNGALGVEGNMPAPMRATIAPYLYADGTWHNTFPATIDEVMLFDTALSAEQVRALVPEPASVCLVGLGALVLIRRRRR